MKDEKFYKNQLKNPLSYDDCVNIIDDYINFTNEWGLEPFIFFTGGDPLLRDDFFDILKYCKNNGVKTCILGNPFHLDKDVANQLEELGVFAYQLSIDGMEKTHDGLRSKGSFRETLRALDVLKKTDIKTYVMFTISKKNESELLKVIDLVAERKVDAFAFTRLVPVGSGKNLKKYLFSAEEYRSVLIKAFERFLFHKQKGCSTRFARKDCDPWLLLERDLGLITPNYFDKCTEAGFLRCPIGKSVAILADGTVLACRKLPVKIGKLPNDSIKDIVESNGLKDIISFRCIEKCGSCKLKDFCIGCAAMSYSFFGDIRKPDINCWC